MQQLGKWVKGGTGRGGAAAKRARPVDGGAQAGVDPDAGALLLVPLSAHRRLKVFTMPGRAIQGGSEGHIVLCDIREMYTAATAPYALPGKKGICITLEQAEALFAKKDDILAAMRAATGAKDDEGGGDDVDGGGDGDKEERKRKRREARATAAPAAAAAADDDGGAGDDE